MSLPPSPRTMLYSEALQVANSVVAILAPHCEQISVAGGVRRVKPTCHDVEVVCIPKRVEEHSLFGPVGLVRDQSFVAACGRIGSLAKGHPEAGRFFQFRTAADVQVDVFTASAETWGFILGIRTGPAEFSKQLMIRGGQCGYVFFEGAIWRDGQKVPVPDEQTFFRICDTRWLPPHERRG